MRIDRPAFWPWLLALPLALVLIWVSASGYQGLNGQDAHDYWRIARAWTAWCSGYERPTMAEHPHGYPVLGALIGWAFGSELIGLRIVYAMAFLVIIFLVRGLLRRHFPPSLTRDQYVLLALALSPFLLRYSLVVMSDVLAMALIMLAFACLLRCYQQQTWAWLVVSVVLALVAIGVRFAVAPLVVGMIASIIHGRAHQREQRWMIIFMIGAVAVTVAYTVIPSALLHDLVQRSPLKDWSPQNALSREQHSHDGVLI